jgi:hypothetical protein
MTPAPRALCVTSAHWMGTVHSPRLLARAGYAVTLITPLDSIAAKSAYAERLVPCSSDPAAAVEQMREHLAAEARPYDLILIADDPTLMAALRRASEPWIAPCLPVDPAGPGPELLLSKARFMEEAQARGLPVPRSRAAGSRAELAAAAEAVGYPVIAKPVLGSSGNGVFVARDPSELRAGAAAADEGAYVVQRFETGNVGGTDVLFDRGEPRAWVSSFKPRVHPAPFGPSATRRRFHYPGARAVLQGFGRMLGLRGIVTFDWVLPSGGSEPLILECNGRPAPYLHMLPRIGLDMAGALRELREGRPATVAAPESQGPEVAIFPQDAEKAIAESDWPRLASWLFAPPGPLMWDEPPLLAAYTRMLAGQLVRKLRAAA